MCDMAFTPSSKPTQMLTTPSSKTNGHIRTPQSRNRLNFNTPRPSPNPNSTRDPTAEHPVEVIGRVRDYPDRKEKSIPPSALQIQGDRQSLRVRTDIGYRDFTLDGVSLSEEDDLEGFYRKFVQSRINGVKLGDKCTVMMYGPTGSGKSHTMFGCAKQPGIVYRSLKDILGDVNGGGESGESVGVGTFVQVTVLEIYNEEIYDLLSSNASGGFGIGWPKGSASKVKLEVMGKKAKNATFIAGYEAGKISKEIQKVEKRRIVKSTLCNERSSRSHCMVILDVPTVGGRLMLVDMAGSENIEQAGQTGFEAKMQTAKINQGNTALKRVVESIANGDSHVPFRDSKLTMLLQDSFEDDKSKILMILCASPDPKELHKTISTLEYGAKAKCIVRGPHTPIKDNGTDDSSSAVILGSRLAAMDQFIYKLQMENKIKEKERIEAQRELLKREEEVSALRAKLVAAEAKRLENSEEEINLKVTERTQKLKRELEQKVQECKTMSDELVEMERRRMEEMILKQQEEVEMLRRRLEEVESELRLSMGARRSVDLEGSSFAKRFMDACGEGADGMVKSMDLDKSLDMEIGKRDGTLANMSFINNSNSETVGMPSSLANGSYLSTVYEEDEEEDEEVQKEVIEEKTVDSSSRMMRIQNIFTLCGDYRELPHNKTDLPSESHSLVKPTVEDPTTTVKVFGELSKDTENSDPVQVKAATRILTHIPLISIEHRQPGAPLPFNPIEKTLSETPNVPIYELSKDAKENSNPVQVKAATKILTHMPLTSIEHKLPLSPLPVNSMENTLPGTPNVPIY
ncbi:microtubule binding motor protein [Lithospermum erythrorhizon]|uniref:Kinesin-like protein KIN-10A n=1 Tax=Lithospermum erythrorhizon TaxID=34254 RepID=A0AAV3QRA7_LITER